MIAKNFVARFFAIDKKARHSLVVQYVTDDLNTMVSDFPFFIFFFKLS